MALGMVTAGSRTSSPSVAIRAYPAKAKNRNPAERRAPPTVVSIGVIRDSDVVEADQPATITAASAVIATIKQALRDGDGARQAADVDDRDDGDGERSRRVGRVPATGTRLR